MPSANRITFAFLHLIFLSAGFLRAQSRSPNFIVILTDDQGYNDLGSFGSPKIKTPRLDKMASEGARFTSFYTAHNVCTPSRAALLTGSYHKRVLGNEGVLFPNSTAGLNPNEVTLADLLKRKGYATAAVGKWHLGDHPKFLPTRQGFDSYYGIPYSNDMKFNKEHASLASDAVFRLGWSREKIAATAPGDFRDYDVPLMRQDKVIEYPTDQALLTRKYTDESLRFIAQSVQDSKPFFLYLAHNMPHIPLFASPQFKGKSARGLYGDVIEELDFNTGRLLDTLKNLGIDGNTLVVYTSDNGPWLPFGVNGGSADPLRDGKGTTWEGGHRVPTLMRWPGTVPAGLVQDGVASTIDLLPTFARLAGIPLPTGEKVNGKDIVIDGLDIGDMLRGKTGATRSIPFFYQTTVIRFGDWKLRQNALYNLKADIHEDTDLSAANPGKAAELRNFLKEFQNGLVYRGQGDLETPEPMDGCTDVGAQNFNSLARRDNGTCVYSPSVLMPTVFGVLSRYENISTRPGGSSGTTIRLRRAGKLEVVTLSGAVIFRSSGSLEPLHRIPADVIGQGIHYLRVTESK